MAAAKRTHSVFEALQRRIRGARAGWTSAAQHSFERDVRTALKQLQADAEANRATLDKLSGKAGAAAKTAPRAKKDDFPADFEEPVRETIRLVRPYTRTSNEKLQVLIKAVEYLEKVGVPGSYVECGVWRGGSMHAVARTLDRLGVHDRELYLFDTFEGMTEPSDRDVKIGGPAAADMLAKSERTGGGVWAIASLEEVTEGLEKVPYPFAKFHLIQGRVEDTVPDQAPADIAMLRLDTDWYESTRHELEQLYPRLSPGGILIVDDYGWFQGSRDATDEYFTKLSIPQHLVRAGSGAIGVKPRL